MKQASFTRLSLTARILLGVALTVSFAPLLGYLLLGLLFFPMWFTMLIYGIGNGDLESFLSLLWLLLLILGGVMGAVALHNVVSRLYGLGWFALAPALLTCCLIVLDYEYLFSDFKAGT